LTTHRIKGHKQKFKITHPFHPLFNKTFRLVTIKGSWGENRVYFYDKKNDITSVPATWTDVITEDPFVHLSAGRSHFRIDDLLQLHVLLQDLSKNKLQSNREEYL